MSIWMVLVFGIGHGIFLQNITETATQILKSKNHFQEPANNSVLELECD